MLNYLFWLLTISNLGHNTLEIYNVLVQIRLTSSKIKRDIYCCKRGTRVASRVAEQPKDLGKFGNIRKISNLGGDIKLSPVSLQEVQIWQQQLKNTQKYISDFSSPIEFHWNSLFCSKYFVQDCLSKQSFGLNSSQSPSNLNSLTFCTPSKHFSNL